MIVKTDRLDLVLEELAEVQARIDALSDADRAEVSPVWLRQALAATSASPWLHGFKIIDRTSRIEVGGCGFKGPPDAEGIVELAYGVHPDQEGRGYATESAKALVDFAFNSGTIAIVRAHTRATNAASQRVLVKAGFIAVGEVIDPEDGPVQRWERRNPWAEQSHALEPAAGSVSNGESSPPAQ